MKRALVVDDHRENTYLLRALLQAHRFDVEEAGDGAEALAKAYRQAPDVIISDLLMPGLDGFMLLRYWRTDSRLGHIPFIVYTATYTEPRDERLVRALGADDFLVKPAEPQDVLESVQRVLQLQERGELESARQGDNDEHALLKDYNEVIVRKLEKKALEAEQANQELRREIAERRNAEDRLRESEERFRATFEQAAAGVAHIAEDGRFMWVNERLCQMTGYERHELLSMTLGDLVAIEDLGRGDATTGISDAALPMAPGERRYYRRNGSPFWAEVITTTVRPANQPAHFVAVIIDITHRKKLEDQLRQAQKMEAIGRLAGGVAHDFNNLLTIICSYSDMLRAGPSVSADDRELVDAINEAGEKAAALTRQLLGFSRRTVLNPEILDLNEVVTTVEKMLRRLLGEDILIATSLTAALQPVRVDRSQLDQVLMNLAVNARDAMPHGGRLTIETSNVVLDEAFVLSHPGGKPGPHVMLAMTDTGIGMTPDVIERIFEPFFTTKSVDQGTGLGLSMVHGIVEQSGGSIHVYSEPGHGSTFKIYLPVTERPATVAPAQVRRAVTGGTETILLVEDEPAVRALAVRILEGQGYRVLTAADGGEALSVARAHAGTIHLVLSDVIMPNVSGPELAQHLKVLFPRLKIVFMSGYTDDAVVRHGLLDARVSFIQKPYTPAGLAQKIRHVLDTEIVDR